MKTNFKFIFKPAIYALAGIINALLITVIVLNSLKIAGVAQFNTVNLALDVSAIILCVILCVVVNIFVFASEYTMKYDYLLYSLGFFRYKVYYKDIIVIREEKTTHTLVVNFQKIIKDKEGKEQPGLQGLVINISNKRKEEFTSYLKSKNKSIYFEVIDKHLDEDK